MTFTMEVQRRSGQGGAEHSRAQHSSTEDLVDGRPCKLLGFLTGASVRYARAVCRGIEPEGGLPNLRER